MEELLDEFDKRCRVCLASNEDNIALNNLVIIDDEEVMLSQILVSCGNLEICDNDHKPQTICVKCIIDAQSAYSFRSTCIRTELILQNELVKVYLHEPEESESIPSIIKGELENSQLDLNIPLQEEDTTTPETETEQEKIFPCGLCSKSYTKMGSLRAHRNRFHVRPKQLAKNIKTMNCKLCDYNYESLSRFMTHMRDHHVQTATSEDAVERILVPPDQNERWLTSLTEYDRGNGVDMKLVETVANLIKFEYETEPIESNEEQLEEGEHVCQYCNNILKTRADLLKHIELAHKLPTCKTKIFDCPYCDYDTTDRSLIILHKNSKHSDEKSHKCTECKARFFTDKELLTHQNKHTHKYTCEFCGHTTNDCSNFKAHKRIHTGEKPYECSECGKKFAQWSTLKYHKITHVEERDFICEICGASFKSPLTLRSHRSRVHSEERPHACGLCDKTFKIKDQLKLHLRYRHHNERKFVCTTCGKAFHKMFTLRVHERVHTGERPYSCEICHRTFTQRCVLKSHMLSWHAPREEK